MEDRTTLLEELKRVHQALLDATNAFEAMLRRPELDAVMLAQVRLKLTSANGRRHVMLERVYKALGPLSPIDEERVRQLRTDSATGLLRSSQHISTWTSRAVEADWLGYVKSSVPVAPSVRMSVRAEQRVLYPLLSSEARAAAA